MGRPRQEVKRPYLSTPIGSIELEGLLPLKSSVSVPESRIYLYVFSRVSSNDPAGICVRYPVSNGSIGHGCLGRSCSTSVSEQCMLVETKLGPVPADNSQAQDDQAHLALVSLALASLPNR